MKSARRRILKGTTAIPLLFTMRTASATALGSAVACLKKDAMKNGGSTKPHEIVKTSSDGWLRVKCDLCELSVYSNNKLKKLDGKYFLGADKVKYWKLSEQFGRETCSASEHTVHSCSARKTGEFRYMLVYVDQVGNQTGYVPQTNGGHPVTGSCWTSIRPRGY